MSMSRAIAICALAIGLLAACAPVTSTPAPSSSDSPVASTTPDPTPTPPTHPEPLLDLTCDDLATASLATLLPDTTPRDPVLKVLDEPTIPSSLSVRSLGGLTCEYSNGVAHDPYAGAGASYVGAEVVVLPDAATPYERWAEGYGDGDMVCPSDYGCSSDVLVGTTWVSIRIVGVANAEAAWSYQNEVSAAVAAAGPGAAPWSIESTVPSTCWDIVPDAEIAGALGIDVPIYGQPPHGGWSLEASADERLGASRCWWGIPSSELGPGTISALPAGRWALDDYRPLLTQPGPLLAVDVAGMEPGDEAWLRCASDDSECTLDLGIDSDWIQVTLVAPDHTAAPPFDRRAGALALAAAIVAARD